MYEALCIYLASYPSTVEAQILKDMAGNGGFSLTLPFSDNPKTLYCTVWGVASEAPSAVAYQIQFPGTLPCTSNSADVAAFRDKIVQLGYDSSASLAELVASVDSRLSALETRLAAALDTHLSSVQSSNSETLSNIRAAVTSFESSTAQVRTDVERILESHQAEVQSSAEALQASLASTAATVEDTIHALLVRLTDSYQQWLQQGAELTNDKLTFNAATEHLLNDWNAQLQALNVDSLIAALTALQEQSQSSERYYIEQLALLTDIKALQSKLLAETHSPAERSAPLVSAAADLVSALNSADSSDSKRRVF